MTFGKKYKIVINFRERGQEIQFTERLRQLINKVDKPVYTGATLFRDAIEIDLDTGLEKEETVCQSCGREY